MVPTLRIHKQPKESATEEKYPEDSWGRCNKDQKLVPSTHGRWFTLPVTPSPENPMPFLAST